MDFELEPDNRGQPDSVLIADLKSTSSKLGGRKLSRELYETKGRFSARTIAKRFGTWERALLLAGLSPNRHTGIPIEECLNDVRRVARELDVKVLTVALYKKHGRFSDKTFRKHFGGFAEAFKAAGLTISENLHARLSDEELFDNLENVWQSIGRQPTITDISSSISKYHGKTYQKRFGGFRKALEAFVAAVKEPSKPPKSVAQEISLAPTAVLQRRSPRGIGWRLRYLVLRRDKFSCRACGASPAISAGVILNIDHIIPWSKGGTTEEGNLQALCEQCNIGKGAA